MRFRIIRKGMAFHQLLAMVMIAKSGNEHAWLLDFHTGACKLLGGKIYILELLWLLNEWWSWSVLQCD
jgi:hypothetical protein